MVFPLLFDLKMCHYSKYSMKTLLVVVKINQEKTYCFKCYNSWKIKKDRTNTEKYCHHCGNSTTVTIVNPYCRECTSN